MCIRDRYVGVLSFTRGGFPSAASSGAVPPAASWGELQRFASRAVVVEADEVDERRRAPRPRLLPPGGAGPPRC